MKNGIEHVDSTDYFLAQDRWVKFWGDKGRAIPNFGNFLGLHSGFKTRADGTTRPFDMVIRKSAARKIKLLASSNYHAILKAYEARRHLNND